MNSRKRLQLIKGAMAEGFNPESTVAVYNFPYQNSRTATAFSRHSQQVIERKLRCEHGSFTACAGSQRGEGVGLVECYRSVNVEAGQQTNVVEATCVMTTMDRN
jgi:hypothetical protein